MEIDSKLTHDFKRVADHKHKWKLGNLGTDARPHPFTPPSRAKPWERKQFQEHEVGKSAPEVFSATEAFRRKRPAVHIDQDTIAASHDPNYAPYSTSNSSAEDVPHGSRTPEPDVGIAYSFDAARGPSDGSDVLGQAMNKAVARFEDQKTTKLVKDEYDVVKDDEEGDAVCETAEDFELVGKFEM